MTNERPRSSMSRNEYQLIIRSKEAYDRTDDPIEKLRFSCQARGFSGYLSMGSMFRRMDTDGSGKLDFEEFSLGMLNTGIDLDNKGLKSLFEAFDKEDTGEISITEFRMTIRPIMPMNRKRLIMEAWKKLDPIGIGVVTHEDIKKVYNVQNYASYLSGDETEEEIFDRFIKSFEEGLYDGKVTIEEFKDYYSGVSASVESDVYFDLMMVLLENLKSSEP